MAGTVYLIPTTLGECDLNTVLPEGNNTITKQIRHFIVEDIRTARRFLRKVDAEFPIDDCAFFILNQHTSELELNSFLAPIAAGHDMGIISEAGCPAVADPGAAIVQLAQQKNYTVVPLVGPSSILLALMASGFNGQSFAFAGYIPIENSERIKALKKLEQRAIHEKQTQLFIETPYRNNKLMADILKHCQPNTLLSIAANITLPDAYSKTKTIKAWSNAVPDLAKKPCIFGLFGG